MLEHRGEGSLWAPAWHLHVQWVVSVLSSAMGTFWQFVESNLGNSGKSLGYLGILWDPFSQQLRCDPNPLLETSSGDKRWPGGSLSPIICWFHWDHLHTCKCFRFLLYYVPMLPLTLAVSPLFPTTALSPLSIPTWSFHTPPASPVFIRCAYPTASATTIRNWALRFAQVPAWKDWLFNQAWSAQSQPHCTYKTQKVRWRCMHP